MDICAIIRIWGAALPPHESEGLVERPRAVEREPSVGVGVDSARYSAVEREPSVGVGVGVDSARYSAVEREPLLAVGDRAVARRVAERPESDGAPLVHFLVGELRGFLCEGRAFP